MSAYLKKLKFSSALHFGHIFEDWISEGYQALGYHVRRQPRNKAGRGPRIQTGRTIIQPPNYVTVMEEFTEPDLLVSGGGYQFYVESKGKLDTSLHKNSVTPNVGINHSDLQKYSMVQEFTGIEVRINFWVLDRGNLPWIGGFLLDDRQKYFCHNFGACDFFKADLIPRYLDLMSCYYGSDSKPHPDFATEHEKLVQAMIDACPDRNSYQLNKFGRDA